MDKLFDLNIEQVLEHWEPEHAVREIIANALDEQFLTKSKEIEIYKSGKKWHIRDFGRGLQYSHFTQNENQEKIASPSLIGKFGVGLKDALAVFHRKGINIEINSKYGHICLTMVQKSGFDIQTLHAVFDEPIDRDFMGTEFIIDGISDTAIEKAKSMFLCFNGNLKLLEKTKYGEVYQCTKTPAVIYINGVQVAIEENFLFSYNITNINAQIKKALNRERSNVGRSAYSDTIKNILRQCKSNSVLVPLVNDLQNIMIGTNCDESSWVDVATHAAKTLSKDDTVVFMTPSQRADMSNQQVEILDQSGKTLVLVTDSVYGKIESSVSTFDTVFQEYTKSFSYKFVPIELLTATERQTFELSKNIVAFLKERQFKYDIAIKISETIRVGLDGMATLGVHDPSENAIIIKRSILDNPTDFCGVLLHEFAHYQHGYPDNTRAFENDLTNMLGHVFVASTKTQTNTTTDNPKSKLKLFRK